VLLGACVLLAAAGTPSSAGIRQSLPRAAADRPDEATGPQVHAFYVIPAGGADRGVDTDGTIAARPRKGSRFLRWDGACVGAGPTCRLTLTANAVATATFAKAKPPRCKPGQKPTKRHPCTRR